MKNSKPEYQAVIPTPFGAIGISMCGERLQGIDLLPSGRKPTQADRDSVSQVIDAVQRYLRDPAVAFRLPLRLEGTDFQRKVWQRMRKIPVGKTLTYGELANELNTSPRAVGNACRANPCPLVVPCHRVVGKNDLGGFSGERGGEKLRIKQWLLSHEGWL